MHKQNATELAEQLYQLQKQYFRKMLLGKHAEQHQQQFIDYLFTTAEHIQLNQIIALEQLVGVVQEQVFKVNLAPPLLSTIGEITQHIHEQLSHNTAPLSSFVSDQQIEHWIRKILEMENIFDYIQDKIENTPQIRALCAYWINQNIERYTPESLLILTDKTTARLPRRVQHFILQQQQRIEEKIEEKTAQLFQHQLLFLFHLPKDEYLNLALSLWNNLKHKPISEFATKSNPIESEELFILLYEYWKDLRHNVNLQNMIANSIEQFYRAFEEESLYYLFSSTGLKVDDIQREARRFAPAILLRLDQLGFLDQLIELFIQPFFNQTATLALIEQQFNA